MEKPRFVAKGGQDMISNLFCGANPKYYITESNHLELALRSDADPDGLAEKNFILRIEKTKGIYRFIGRFYIIPILDAATKYKPDQYAGVKKKVSIRSVGPGPGHGRGGPGRGGPGRGGPARPPPRGRGGPPAMVDVLNPGLAKQLAVAQNKANANVEADFNPGHGAAAAFNAAPAGRDSNWSAAPVGPSRNAAPPRQQQNNPASYDYGYDYPKPVRHRPKPKAQLKSAPTTQAPSGFDKDRYDREQAEKAEQEAIALRAEQEFKKSLIMPCILLIIGLVILGFVVKNKRNIDAEKAKTAAIENEDVSGLPTSNPLVSDQSSEPKTPEDAKKIEEIYKENLPVINEDPRERS